MEGIFHNHQDLFRFNSKKLGVAFWLDEQTKGNVWSTGLGYSKLAPVELGWWLS